MSHIALYRAWRSRTFREIAGQQHIVKTLQNALKEGRFSHAYLFSGPRGTGKTSVAKILARALNCEHGPAAEPCNECESCRKVAAGSVMDVLEIDAASNRGVEEIRDLRDNVKYAPSEVRRKVYIIDEVHMLTTEAFNALLKTLEEPPPHVVFILATTEPHRIPATIHSRCQRFDFRRISVADQMKRLEYICEQEAIRIETDALQYIARLSDGGMRDALSLLDQITSYAGREIRLEQVLEMTGGMAAEQFAELAAAVQSGDVAQALDWADTWMQEGKSPDKCLENLILYFRDLLMIQVAPEAEQLTDRILDVEAFREAAQRFERGRLFAMVDILNRYHAEMKYASHPRTLFEVALMKICFPDEAEERTGASRAAEASTADVASGGRASLSGGEANAGGAGAVPADAGGSVAGLLRRVAMLEERIATLEQQGAFRRAGGRAGPSADRTAYRERTVRSESNVGDAAPAAPAARDASARGAASAARELPPREQGAVARSDEATRSSRDATADGSGSGTTLRGRDGEAYVSQLREAADETFYTEVCRRWEGVLATIKERKITVHAWLVNGEPVMAGEEFVLVGFKNTIHRETTEKPANRTLIEQVLAETFGRPLRLETVMLSQWEKWQQTAAPAGSARSDADTAHTNTTAVDGPSPSSASAPPFDLFANATAAAESTAEPREPNSRTQAENAGASQAAKPAGSAASERAAESNTATTEADANAPAAEASTSASDPPSAHTSAGKYEQEWINEAIALFGEDLVTVKKEREDDD